MDLIEQITDELLKLGSKSEELVGCTATDIQYICEIQGVKDLPELYKQFLGKLGRSAGKLFRGSEALYSSLTETSFKERAENLLQGQGVKGHLQKQTYVFLWHQNYLFLYFDADSGEYDPLTHIYIEGDAEPKPYIRFSEILIREIELIRKNVAKSPNKAN